MKKAEQQNITLTVLTLPKATRMSWNNIFALWHSAANGGHIHQCFILELAMVSIERTDETKNI